MIKIERGIPVPRSRSPLRAIFAQMKVGDSFLITDDMHLPSVRSGASRYGLDTGGKFTVRKSPNGPRCWRIK